MGKIESKNLNNKKPNFKTKKTKFQ